MTVTARQRQVTRAPLAAATVGAAVCALVVVLLAADAGPQPVPAGLPDPGAVTGWGVPLAKLLLNGSVAMAAGGALLAAVLAPGPGDTLLPVSYRALRFSSRWAAVSAASAVSLLVLQMSDIIGAPPGELLTPETVINYLNTFPQGRAALAVLGFSLVLVAVARTALTRTQAFWALLLACLSAVPFALTGHASGSSDHDLATSSLVVHVLAATLWTGGLLALLWHRRQLRAHLGPASSRFSSLALGCFIAIALSGVANALTRLDNITALFSSAYGREVLAKASLLMVLGGLGAAHRHRALPQLQDGDRRAFARLAAVEVTVMAVAFGVAVALSRTPTPESDSASAAPSQAELLLGYPVPQLSVERLLTAWRPDLLVLLIGAASATAYLVAAHRAESWSRWRTAAFLTGTAIAVLALAGGPATFAMAMLSVHATQHLLVATTVPALLVAGAPGRLAAQVLHRTAPEEPRGLLALGAAARASARRAGLLHPAVVLTVFTITTYGMYISPLLERSLRTHWLHLLLALAALGAGLVLFGAVAGLGWVRRTRIVVLAGSASLGAAVGASLVLRPDLLAGAWFAALKVPGVDMAADQRAAGLVIALLGLGTPAVVLACGLPRQPATLQPRGDHALQSSGSSSRP